MKSMVIDFFTNLFTNDVQGLQVLCNRVRENQLSILEGSVWDAANGSVMEEKVKMVM